MNTTVVNSSSLLPLGSTSDSSSLTDPKLLSLIRGLTYVLIGSLGAIVWDITSNIGADYQILKSSITSLPTVVYVISRISILVSFTAVVVFYTREADLHCVRTLHISGWALTVAIPATTLLFFFRVRAVYRDNKYVTTFFFAVWLGIVAGCLITMLVPPRNSPAEEQNPYCPHSNVNLISFVTSVNFVPMINDILIFCAITWRLVQTAHLDPECGLKTKMRVAVFGYHLPAFSRTLLRDGQAYFLGTVLLSIVTNATFYNGAHYSTLLSFPNIAIMHMMACRLYRQTKLGIKNLTVPSDPVISHPMLFRVGPQLQANGQVENTSRGIFSGPAFDRTTHATGNDERNDEPIGSDTKNGGEPGGVTKLSGENGSNNLQRFSNDQGQVV